MEQEIKNTLAEQSAKIDAIYASVEKTRKYFVTILWVTLIGFVLPLLGILFSIPSILSLLTGNVIDAGY